MSWVTKDNTAHNSCLSSLSLSLLPLLLPPLLSTVFAKHFRNGHQEDAHEFLRYFIDSLQKISLIGHQPSKLDMYSKHTTVIHQIFGGYHRSQGTVCQPAAFFWYCLIPKGGGREKFPLSLSLSFTISHPFVFFVGVYDIPLFLFDIFVRSLFLVSLFVWPPL